MAHGAVVRHASRGRPRCFVKGEWLTEPPRELSDRLGFGRITDSDARNVREGGNRDDATVIVPNRGDEPVDASSTARATWAAFQDVFSNRPSRTNAVNRPVQLPPAARGGYAAAPRAGAP